MRFDEASSCWSSPLSLRMRPRPSPFLLGCQVGLFLDTSPCLSAFRGGVGAVRVSFLAAHNSKYARRIYIEEPVGGVYSLFLDGTFNVTHLLFRSLCFQLGSTYGSTPRGGSPAPRLKNLVFKSNLFMSAHRSPPSASCFLYRCHSTVR